MRTLNGTVISAKMQKTIVVRVDTLKQHPKYGKHYRVSKKFKAHDEKSEYRVGDIIMMQEARPLSREKRWQAIALIKRTEVEVKKDAADE
ncbi:MAG: 30S ribosomal protein S17 [Candidatus Sungiibacteriota bacterium]